MFAAYWNGVSVDRQPAELPPPPPVVGKARNMTRQYDHLFRQYGRGLPVPFLRALSYKESGQNPNSERDKGINLATRLIPGRTRKDSYWGLFQVGVLNVLPGWNKDHPSNTYNREQLFNAPINTAIAAWQIENQIIKAYERFAAKWDIPELNPPNRWNNEDWVRLVLAGWNSGHSRAGGVQAAARYLKSKGIPVTHDNMYIHGKGLWKGKVRRTKYLNPRRAITRKKGGDGDKRGWQRDVARHYYEQRGLPPTPPAIAPGGGAAVAVLLLLGLLGISAVS